MLKEAIKIALLTGIRQSAAQITCPRLNRAPFALLAESSRSREASLTPREMWMLSGLIELAFKTVSQQESLAVDEVLEERDRLELDLSGCEVHDEGLFWEERREEGAEGEEISFELWLRAGPSSTC